VAAAEGAYLAVNSAALVPGRDEVVAGYEDGAVRVWQLVEPRGRIFWPTTHRADFIPGTHTLVTDTETLEHVQVDGRLQLRRHGFRPASVEALAAHPHEPYLLVGRKDGRLQLWDLQARREVQALDGHEGMVTALAVHPDGDRLVSGGADGCVRLWQLQDDLVLPLATVATELGAVQRADWSPDGKLLGVVAGDGVRLFDGDGRQSVPLPSAAGGPHCYLTFGPSQLVLSRASGVIEVHGLTDGSMQTLQGHQGGVTELALSPDGGVLASLGNDSTISVWQLTSAQPPLVIKQPEGVSWLAFDPRGGWLVVGGTPVCKTTIVDCATGTPVAETYGGSGPACAAFVAEEPRLLLGAPEGTVWGTSLRGLPRAPIEADAHHNGKLVTLRPRQIVVPGGHLRPAWGVVASPDGQYVVTTGHDGVVKLWETEGFTLVRDLLALGDIAWNAAWASDSRRVAVCTGGEVAILTVPDGREVQRVDGHRGLAIAAAFLPDGRRLVTGDLFGGVLLHHLTEDRPVVTLKDGAPGVHDLALRPDGLQLAAAADDRSVLLWDLTTPEAPPRTLEDHRGAVWAVAYSPDGRYLASTSALGRICLREAATLTTLIYMEADNRLHRGLSFSSDGRFLAASCYGPPSITWDLAELRRRLADMGVDWPDP
jgi:WD40 repeat protein